MPEMIGIEGLRDFRKALRNVDRDLGKALRLTFNETAEEIVDRVKPQVPKKDGKARGTVRARSTQSRGKVLAGTKRIPYYPWLDFGGKVGKFDQIERPYKKDGRYIYPTYKKMKKSGEIRDSLQHNLEKLIRTAGLELT